MRQNQVPQIVTLLNQILENHTMFEQKTVRGTLETVAALMDWNELSLFDVCLPKIGEFLRIKELRAGAFKCVSATVGKGMSELDKLNIIN